MYGCYMQWAVIPDFPNYEACDVGGAIRPLPGGRRLGRELKHSFTRGYHYVGLYRDGKLHRVRVHRQVLWAHVGPPPTGCDGLHKDDNQDNNSLANLYWGTPTQNAADALANGKRTIPTVCGKGHRYTQDNTYIRKDTGMRMCRRCCMDRDHNRRGVVNPRGPYKGRSDDT